MYKICLNNNPDLLNSKFQICDHYTIFLIVLNLLTSIFSVLEKLFFSSQKFVSLFGWNVFYCTVKIVF